MKEKTLSSELKQIFTFDILQQKSNGSGRFNDEFLKLASKNTITRQYTNLSL